MNIGSQTAAVTASPIQKLELVNDSEIQNSKIGILGCLNPDSSLQRDMFYISPTSFKIRLVDNNKAIVPPALSNPNYPNSYEMIFFDRGTDNDNPSGWINLYNINARTLLNIEKNEPWKIIWDFDGSYGIQTATIKGVSFSRTTAIKDDGSITGFNKWRINSDTAYGSIRPTFNTKDVNHLNNLGWMNSEYMKGTGITETDYPDAFNVIKKLINNNIVNNLFTIDTTGDKESIKLKTVTFPTDIEVFIGI
jgi:hypothetical protein